jgi:hypothetical protein
MTLTKRQEATTFDERKRQLATSLLSLFVASLRSTFSPNDFVRGWCLEKIKAFKFQKAVRIAFG